jgi:hypothetical protein
MFPFGETSKILPPMDRDHGFNSGAELCGFSASRQHCLKNLRVEFPASRS